MMKKRILAICMALCMMLSAVPVALAAGVECTDADCTHEAAIGDVHYDTLAAALNAGKGKVVKLLQNVKVTKSMTLARSTYTIDLNNHDIGFAEGCFYRINSGITLNLIGTGKLYEEVPKYSPIVINGSTTGKTTLNVGKDVILEGFYGGYIDQSSGKNQNIIVKVEGTLIGTADANGQNGAGFYIHGNFKNMKEATAPQITISATAHVFGAGSGIYAAGYAIWNLAGDITGNAGEALSIKSGTFNITGGTYTAKGAFADPAEANSNGSEVTGAALSITSNKGYAPKTEVNVTGGTFISENGYAVYEGIAQQDGTPAAEASYATLSISDGAFTGGADKGAVSITTANDKKVISAGSFSESVAQYVTDDLKYESSNDGTYTYYPTLKEALEVGDTVATIAAATAGADEPTYSVTFNNDGAETTFTAAENETILLSAPTKSGYTFKGWQVGDTLVNETAYQITADTVFTAQWEKDLVPATGIELDETALTMDIGDTETLTATVTPDDATDTTVTWSSSNPAVATVDNGVVTAVSEGTATITVTTVDGGFSATCTVTVTAKAVTVTFDGAKEKPITVLPGTEIELPTPDDTRDEIFRYWTVEGDSVGTRYYGGETVEITEDITFVANWKDNSYIPIPPTQPTKPTKPTKPAEPDEPDEPEEPVVSELPFTDVDVDNTFYEAVKYVAENGLMTGVDTTAFAPYNEFTRAQVATILYRLEKEPAVAFAATFPDVTEDQWFASAVLWGNSKGILLGHDTGKFGPDDGVTFEQMLTILYRYAALKGYDTAARAEVSGFECSDYAAEAVSWAMAHGMVSAADGAALKAPAARCQVAQVLAVFCQTVVMK